MHEDQQKEQFSNAYVRAVAAAAYKPEVDDDSVDWGIGARGAGGTVRSPKVELQLKSTSQDVIKADHLAYPLKRKNFDELRFDDYQVPRILVVVVVPDDVAFWLTQSEDALALRHCGYWLSIRGRPVSTNADEVPVTVHLPRTQVFSVVDLTAMMDRVGEGGLP